MNNVFRLAIKDTEMFCLFIYLFIYLLFNLYRIFLYLRGCFRNHESNLTLLYSHVRKILHIPSYFRCNNF